MGKRAFLIGCATIVCAASAATALVACGDDEPAGACPEAECRPDSGSPDGGNGTTDATGDGATGPGAPGLDPTFGTNGLAVLGGSDDSENASGVARQPDGKVVAVVWNQAHYQMEIVRWNADGSLDATFGANGKVLVWSDSSTLAREILVQPDGKIVAVAAMSYTQKFRALVVRLDATGAFDATFGTNGRVVVPEMDASRIALQADGKILVTGGAKTDGDGGYGFEYAAVRLNANGSIDTGFGTNGRVKAAFGDDPLDDNYPSGIAVDPNDGKVVIGGAWRKAGGGGQFVPAVARFSSAGVPDDTWGTQGKAVFPPEYADHYATANILVQSDSKVVVGGIKGSDMFVARFDASGAPDAAYGTNGVFTTTLPGTYRKLTMGLAFGPSNSIVALVSQDVSDGFLVRTTSAGVIDTTFNGTGIVQVPAEFSFGGLGSSPDGSVVCAGGAQRGQFTDTIALHYDTSGALDTAFGTGGKATANAGASRDAFSRVVVQANGTVSAIVPQETSSLRGTFHFTAQGVVQSIPQPGSFVSVPHTIGVDPVGRMLIVGEGGQGAVVVQRLDVTGAADSTFNASGASSLAIEQTAYPYAVTSDVEGRVYVAGRITVLNSTDPVGFVAATTVAGAHDTAGFGSAGVARYGSPGKHASINAIAVQPDGMIVGAGTIGVIDQKHDDVLVVRWDKQGNLDPGFTGEGSAAGAVIADVTTEGFDRASAVAIQPDGKILVAGVGRPVFGHATYQPEAYHYSDAARSFVLRLLPDGKPDTSFGTQGKVLLTSLGEDVTVHTLDLLADGRMILAGTKYTDQRSDGFVLRLAANGDVDPSFAGAPGGVFLLGQGNATGFFGASRQADGKVVLAGFIHRNSTGDDFLLARLVP